MREADVGCVNVEVPPWIEPDWPAPPGIRAFTTLRHGQGHSAPPFDDFNFGLGCGDAEAAVRSNRRRLCALAKLPTEPLWLRQVHGREVLRVNAVRQATLDADSAPEADASVTRSRDTVLAILSADCLPVLFCAEDGSEIAAAHAGWRGLIAGVMEATVAAMATPPERVLAWLGPAAGAQAYEVGEEVRWAFVSRHAKTAARFTASRPGHALCDLFGLARGRLESVGVSRVFGGEHCTISQPEAFFSHRRDGRSGRMASLIWRLG
jgi:YfiH family protein